MPTEPLFAFGYGLSYTSFAYSDLKLAADIINPGDLIKASVEIKNTGSKEGVEIAQLYINDVVSSVTTAQKELKAYRRVNLKPGEKKNH